MAKQRKLTKKDKLLLTEQNICWKCYKKLKRENKKLKCTSCDFEVIICS